MKMSDLVEEAIEELNEEAKGIAIFKIKERLVEIREAKRILKRLEDKYTELLGEEIEDANDITDIE